MPAMTLVADTNDENAPASTVFSHLTAEHSHGRGILGFLTLQDTLSLRLTCHEMRDEIRKFAWNDAETFILGRLPIWRKQFPLAKAVNVSCRADVFDEDLRYFSNCQTVNISWCRNITDEDFAYLSNVHTLTMMGCNQITDMAFKHLKKIRVLDISHCSQITDWGLMKLVELEKLNISGCSNITNRGLAPLVKLKHLIIDQCSQPTMTGRVFEPLKQLHTVSMVACMQMGDDALFHLGNVNTLDIAHCRQTGITDKGFSYLKNLENLRMSYCGQPTITDTMFDYLLKLKTLNITGCGQAISDEKIADLSNSVIVKHTRKIHRWGVCGDK